MHDDLIDAVEWAVEQGVAERDKVAIMGGSYGGYATLAGLTFTPEVFACGVDIVGPSNLETLLETIPPYWEPMVKQFHQRMGDPTRPKARQLLRRAQSRCTRPTEISRPLLIGQGANDPRVKQSESRPDRRGDEGRTASRSPTWCFPTKATASPGRRTTSPSTPSPRDSSAANLGGRCEPPGDTVKASTAQFLARA